MPGTSIGKVVIVTTHAVFNPGLRTFDKVLCLAAGGHFAWFGPAEGVLDHFGAAGIEEVFEKLERWEPARAGHAPTGHEADPLRRRHPAVKRALGFWRQLVVLVGRQLKVRVRDPAGVLLALPPSLPNKPKANRFALNRFQVSLASRAFAEDGR